MTNPLILGIWVLWDLRSVRRPRPLGSSPVAIDIDLIVLKIWRRSNCGEGQAPKGRGHFQDSAGLSTLARHTRERDPNNGR
jgi:hypothetical protein